jgi:putative phage-type endonuclease
MKVKTHVPLTSGDVRRANARYGKSPRTAAVPLLGLDAYGTEAWHVARRSMIGASEMAAVLGRSPFASPFSLWWSKQEGWSLEQTLSMRLGHELEPIIAKLFAEQRPDLLVCKPNASLWRSPLIEWLACTPDYLAVAYDSVEDRALAYASGGADMDGEPVRVPHGPCHVEPVECKSDEGGKGWGRPGTDEVPDHHRVQVLQQCAVFGSPRGHLVRMAGKRFSAYVIECDDAAQTEVAEWVAAGKTFMASLEFGVPPELDGHDATTDTLSRIYAGVSEEWDAVVPDELAVAYDDAGVALALAKDRYSKASNDVRGVMRNQRFGVVASTGARFVDRRVYKRRGYEVAATMVDALYPIKRGTHSGPRHAAPDVPAAEPGVVVDGPAGASVAAHENEAGGGG